MGAVVPMYRDVVKDKSVTVGTGLGPVPDT